MRRRAAAHAAAVALVSSLACCAARSDVGRTHPDDVAALIAFEAAVRDPSGRLASWSAPDTDPCLDGWRFVTCTGARVTAVNISCAPPHCGPRPLLAGKPRPAAAPVKGGGAALTALLTGLSAAVAIDASGNALHGVLPGGALPATLQFLSLAGNKDLHGPLPASWGDAPSLHTVDVGGTKLSGRLPASWGDAPLSFTRVSFRDACGVCGPLPASWATVAVDARGSNLGGTCGSTICAPKAASVALQVGVVMGVVLGAAAGCALKRGVRPFDPAARGGPPSTPLARLHAALFGVVAPREPPLALHGSGAVGGSEAYADAAAAAAKRPPPCLVVQPDGSTVSYGLRLTPLPADDDGCLSDGGDCRAAAAAPRRRCASPPPVGDVEMGRREP